MTTTERMYDYEQAAREEVRERIEGMTAEERDDFFETDDPDYDGMMHEIADGGVPVYTATLMELAADDPYLATEEPELGPAFDGSPTPVNIVAANIYERLHAAAWDEYRLARDEWEDERDDDEEE